MSFFAGSSAMAEASSLNPGRHLWVNWRGATLAATYVGPAPDPTQVVVRFAGESTSVNIPQSWLIGPSNLGPDDLAPTTEEDQQPKYWYPHWIVYGYGSGELAPGTR
ncbi:MAG: hypothetical protein AAGA56_21655, partial [Myxococcota bacterium]